VRIRLCAARSPPRPNGGSRHIAAHGQTLAWRESCSEEMARYRQAWRNRRINQALSWISARRAVLTRCISQRWMTPTDVSRHFHAIATARQTRRNADQLALAPQRRKGGAAPSLSAMLNKTENIVDENGGRACWAGGGHGGSAMAMAKMAMAYQQLENGVGGIRRRIMAASAKYRCRGPRRVTSKERQRGDAACLADKGMATCAASGARTTSLATAGVDVFCLRLRAARTRTLAPPKSLVAS